MAKSSLRLVNILDVAMILGEAPQRAEAEGVANRLRNYYLGGASGFNHDPVLNRMYPLYSGSLSIDEAKKQIRQHKNEVGKKQHLEILNCISRDIRAWQGHLVHPYGKVAIAIKRHRGRSIFVALKAPIIKVVQGAPLLVVAGFRKDALYSREQLDLILSFAHHQLTRDGYSGGDIQYLIAKRSNLPGTRALSSVLASRRVIWTLEETERVLTTYADVVANLLDRKVGDAMPDLAGYHVVDPFSAPRFI